jgi:hypothetical protein
VTALSAEALLEDAAAVKGLDDFGPASYREGLDVLIAAAESEARLSEPGRRQLAAMLRSRLENRLELYDWHGQHPEIAAERVEAPVVIVGLWRTGTTILSYLLAQDPDSRSLRRWEASIPCPPPGWDPAADAERIERLERQIARQHETMPELAAINIQEATGPTECVLTISHEFKGQLYDASLFVPSYYEWNRRTDQRSAYEHHLATLQLLQWKEPASRWMLKAPSHTLSLDALVSVYPDARLVVSHRDPTVSLASACDFWELQMRTFSDDLDLHAIGALWTRIYDDAMACLIDFHERHPDAMFDLQYEVLREPLGAVEAIYDAFDLPLTDVARTRMQGFLDGHQAGRHGAHTYSLERYGLDRDALLERFHPYIEYFDIAIKP